jgi:hypothetical protein
MPTRVAQIPAGAQWHRAGRRGLRGSSGAAS